MQVLCKNCIDRIRRKYQYGLLDPPALAVFVTVFHARYLYPLMKDRKKDCVARSEHFTRQWPFHTAVTVSDGGDCFALLSCTSRWPFYTRKDGVSVSVRKNLVRISYCMRKDGVSFFVRGNLVQISYCLRKYGVSVFIRDKLVTSFYCS